MKLRILIIGLVVLLCIMQSVAQQNTSDSRQDLFQFSGQLSTWLHLNPSNDLPLYIGGRYIPKLNYRIPLTNNSLIDFEGSANIYGNIGMHLFDSLAVDGRLRPYRLWARYSTEQMEIRLGLQKIDFGTATMLRALRWFDQIDPRDPLKLTNGVFAALGRYYFLNNANIWFWVLYGNDGAKGLEIISTNSSTVEVGGRVQFPVPAGETGISYHHRTVDSEGFNPLVPEYSYIPENRFGLDAKWDFIIGIWFEAVWVNKNKNMGQFTNQELFTVGTDYTFGLGNGLNVVLEHMLTSYDQKAFEFEKTTNFTALSASYPVGMFDNIQVIVYYDWVNNGLYNYINWYKQFDKTALYIMGYWNPDNSELPEMGLQGENLYGGFGLQVMFVFNH